MIFKLQLNPPDENKSSGFLNVFKLFFRNFQTNNGVRIFGKQHCKIIAKRFDSGFIFESHFVVHDTHSKKRPITRVNFLFVYSKNC